MKSFLNYLEDLKAKPHHVRKQVAFAAASAGTGLIAFVWFLGSLSSGAFALKGTTNTAPAAAVVAASSDTGSADGLAGASAAIGSQSGPARIQIIDAATSSTLRSKQASQTTIPF